MKLLVDSRKFRECIANAEDRVRFDEYMSGPRNYSTMPLMRVDLPESKTITQLGTIWLDFATVGRLLHCDPSYVYYQCLRAEQLKDIWLQERDGGWHFSTLSGLTKEETSAAIPRLRDFMQETVNLAHGEYVPIVWAARENINGTEAK